MADKSKGPTSSAQQELDKVDAQFQAFDANVKELTMDRMNMAPRQDSETQTNLSGREIEKSKEIYLKPDRKLSDRQKFNEDYRKQWEHDKEYVQFIAEHKEIIGETIEMWTHPYGGMGAEFWKVPTGKPVWGPRYLAEQIKRCSYHRLTMQQSVITGADGMGQYYGSLAVDTTVQRLDAQPVSTKKTFFMGSRNF